MSLKNQAVSLRAKVAMTSVFIIVLSLVLPSSSFISRLIDRTVFADTGTGAVSLTTIGSPATENFDTLSNTAGSTTNTTLPTGWYITETGGGARDNEQYAVDTGGSTTGDTYSYGAAASTERALGELRSGTLIPLFGAKFTNNTGATITSLDVAYTGEQWRFGGVHSTVAERLDFQYSDNATDLSTGTYLDANALDFNPPVTTGTAGALNGNAAANRTAISSTISGLSIPAGASFFIRINDVDATGADDGLSVDDFSITPQGAPPGDTAPSVSSTNPANSATGVALASNISITFSEAVTAPAGAFTISCASSGAHPFSLSGGPTIFTLDPTVNFSSNEVCTVTVDDLQIADVDTNDPPDNMAADYVFSFTTADVGSCGTAFTATYTIQGSGTASPIVGNTVTTEGVVIGDFQGAANLSGFYIQDPLGDANPATSDGLLVFDGAAPAIDVSPGDRVRTTGTVAETFNNTQLVPTSITVCSTGNPLPAATAYDLPEPVNNDLERVENMLVTFPETLTVSGNFGQGRFGELVLSSDGRLYQQNSFDRPGTAGSIAVQALNLRRYVVLDDGKSGQNLDPTPYFNATPTRRVGDTTAGVTGVLTFDFSEYRLQPTGPVSFVDANPRPAAPTITGIKAVGMNVLNYFNGDGAGGGFPTARGANTLAEFNRQRAKIIAAITAINPDVVGISEMENDGVGANSAIQDLVNGLNAASAPGTYTFISEPGPGTDAIKVSIIYKPGILSTVGAAVNDPDPIHNRPPLAQTFQQISNNEKFTFIVNHFKSKGGTCPGSGGDADAGDGQGCFNATRVAQANALLTFIQQRKAAAGDPDVLSVGDYNSYGEEDPMFALEQDPGDLLADGVGGLYSQTKRYVPVADRYSYQFNEESGELDHAMATKTMHQQITATAIFHNNADEPIVLDYNVEFKSAGQQALNVGTAYRTSDHDPVVIGMTLLQPTAADGRITGRITDPNGVPIAGAVVNLAGSQTRTFITDANGNYAFENVETSGFYTVTPSRANYSFSPASRSFSQLGNHTEAVFTGSSSATVVNPIDTPEYFVRQHYLDFLGREPDETGFNFWSGELRGCGRDGNCFERRRVNVSAAYFLSMEFMYTGGLVDGLYRTSYGRRPLFAEFLPDARSVSPGLVVGQGNWYQQMQEDRRAFVAGWTQRPSFRAVYDGMSDGQYVDALISHAGVDFSAAERDAFVNRLSAGTPRAEVLQQIAENDRVVCAKLNEMFVMMEYFGYLRRDPDEAGFRFWLNKLNEFHGNFEDADMVKAFIVSGEYRSRFTR
jgi:predicted extracellular nuclease